MRAGVAVAAASAGIALTAATPSAFAASTGAGPTTNGTATLSGASGAITSGDLNTGFLISLSNPGVCSANSVAPAPQDFVYGFMVPPPAQGTTLAQEMAGIDWSGGVLSSYQPLFYDSAGDQYGPANTSTTGQPIAPPSNITFGYTNSFTSLAGQTWEVGLACESNNTTTDFWSIPVTFDANGNWTTQSATAAPEVPMAVILPGAAVGLLGGSVLFARRRNRKAAATV